MARPGRAAKRDVIPRNLNLAGSLKCSWFSNTFTGFSCLVSCVKMPSCFARGSNRSNKGLEKRLSFHYLPMFAVKNKQLTGGWTSFVGMHMLFQKLENVYVCSEHFTDRGL